MKIVILGATSGIGREVARTFVAAGWQVGAAGRDLARLEELRAIGVAEAMRIDVLDDDAPARLSELISALGGCDVYLHCSGIGYNNPALDAALEVSTVETNGVGFTRMTTAAFNYFRAHGGGQLAAISSIAGTRGMGGAAAYSATKRYQNTYLDALAQLSRMERSGIRITDIRPGFVDTPLLGDGKYPMPMRPEKVANSIFRAIVRRRRRVVIDGRYAVLVRLWRLIPQWIWERMKVGTK